MYSRNLVSFLLLSFFIFFNFSVAADAGLLSPELKKVIYMTFDMDMNDKMYTEYLEKSVLWYDPELLSYLEVNKIPATFFLSGLFVKAYPSVLSSLASNELFSFQNHAYDESSFVSHCYWLKVLNNNRAKIVQIRKTEDMIKQTTGQTATYFRFPGICHDRKNDRLVTSLGLKIDNGTIISGDPFNTNVEKMVETILDEAKDRGVIIMHAGGRNSPKSLEVLRRIVPSLRAKGYEFKRLQSPVLY